MINISLCSYYLFYYFLNLHLLVKNLKNHVFMTSKNFLNQKNQHHKLQNNLSKLYIYIFFLKKKKKKKKKKIENKKKKKKEKKKKKK